MKAHCLQQLVHTAVKRFRKICSISGVLCDAPCPSSTARSQIVFEPFGEPHAVFLTTPSLPTVSGFRAAEYKRVVLHVCSLLGSRGTEDGIPDLHS